MREQNFCSFPPFSNIPALNFPFLKPTLCPHCGISTDAIFRDAKQLPFSSGGAEKSLSFVSLLWACTACKRHFLTCYVADKKRRAATLVYMYPPAAPYAPDPLVQDLSPRFVDLYRQAQAAEDLEAWDVAAMGYRAALEVLLKDYAIRALGRDEKAVARSKLADLIVEVFHEQELVNCADVVRLLGNDYTCCAPCRTCGPVFRPAVLPSGVSSASRFAGAHPSQRCRRYTDVDFLNIRRYLDLLVSSVAARLAMLHPPVSRLRPGQSGDAPPAPRAPE